MTPRERLLVLVVLMAIILSTFLAAILVGLGLFEKADPELFRWLIGVGIAEILGVILVALRDSFRAKGRVSINVLFAGAAPQQISLDTNQCAYELRDGGSGQTKHRGELLLTRGPGGWECVLPPGVSPTDYIRLLLTERNGDQWEVGWFVPLAVTREADRL